ncbi:hypothetical protein NX059_007683 [Plenodomus lindquistii]|nr:hypothetical protein NX059_007683 [Plenodomus lindquistii]
MPRRQFQADLAQAVEGVAIAGVSNVQPGGDDGEFTFMCLADGQQLSVSVLVPELSDYPSSHECMIFGADNASASVAATLSDINQSVSGKTITQILELVSARLKSTDGDGDQQMLDSQEFEDFEASDDEADEYFPGDEDLDSRPVLANYPAAAAGGGHTEATLAFRKRIQHDFLIAKNEGFRVGYMGGLAEGFGCYVSISIRISKLGISGEAMQAWQLEPSEYLIGVMHYPNGYKSMDDLKSYDAAQARRNFGVRVGVSTRYKPTLKEAIQCFTVLSKEDEKRREQSHQNGSQETNEPSGGFRNSFISRPLNDLMEQRFHMLLKYRYGGMPWAGAELFYNNQVHTATHNHHDSSHDMYYKEDQVNEIWPSVVTDDHITSSFGQQHSLPLVAMQFVLRHFVRCTEFCLICFNKMPDDLQAIKPYVCDDPLCLYQYMSLGFGPSIEHEILSQPKVVDLLTSFCYTSARLGRLKDFPNGLSLSVPPIAAISDAYAAPGQPYGHYYRQPAPQPVAQPSLNKGHSAISTRYCDNFHEMLFEDKTKPCPVRNGQWIVLRLDDYPAMYLHCRVVDASYYPSVRVSEAIRPPRADAQFDPYATQALAAHQPAQAPPKLGDEFRSASFHIYNENFDKLGDQQKRDMLSSLLDLLPPVSEMKKYLLRKAQSPLSSWVDRLPPAVLGILRWIIASNRACILQVDREEDDTSTRKSQDRLYGMAGWAQFRFAMGAPDKERRFVQAVRETTERLNLKYPTLFAWHGSPLQNWHSIIREGLHFNDTLHGRAFGNGVYHAPDVNTSLGYSQYGGGLVWTPSELQIQQALALNEIVNAPSEFVSSSPHLVVAQLDWIQTRYLFVKTRAEANTTTADPGAQPLEFLEQDPKRTPRGINGNLVIPIHAIAASRRPKTVRTTQHKRQKASGTTRYDPIEIEDDAAVSDATDDEDLDIFDEETVTQQFGNSLPTPNSVVGDKGNGKGKGKIISLSSFGNRLFGSKPSAPQTDYVPGTLDYSTLPMLKMPSWASTAATRRLMKDFKELISVQNKEPLHELGWHIDEDKIENMYQWIVELHSFDSALPLAKEMKAKDLKSIVLELRFGKDYPMSPPFVRVVRPRFLSFMQGGGGHVTAGGAMCMELLTNDGWSAVSSIESVLVQVRMAISSVDPKPARLAPGAAQDYGVGEAVDAYMRACATHGWTVPPGFREMALGGNEGSAGGYPF